MLTSHEGERNLPAKPPPAPLLVWPGMRRTALITGITAGELVLLGAIVNSPWLVSVGDALGIILSSTLVFGGIGAGVAARVTRRRGGQSMAGLEADLQHATQLMERRLINENEYLTLKAKLIQDYSPGIRQRGGLVTRAAVWSAVTGLTLAQLGIALNTVWDPVGLLIATVTATTLGAGVGGVSSLVMQRLRQRVEQRALSAPADRPRLDDPVLRDRPALEG